jgi:transcriptional regulator with XRE-family HTH domain
MLENTAFCVQNAGMAWNTRLKKIMRLRDVSGTELAQKLGVGTSSVSEWTRGLAQPKFETLATICQMLDVPMAYLFSEASDSGSEIEQEAYVEFEQTLRYSGPLAALALLRGSSGYARDLGEVRLSPRPVSHDKRPNRPQTPPDPKGVPVDPPIRGRGPKKL